MPEQTTTKKSNIKLKIIAFGIIALAILDYSKLHYVLGKSDTPVVDSTSISANADTLVKADTTKK